MTVTAPGVVNGINHLNGVLNPGNLVPGPGINAIAVSIAGTIDRDGTNGIRCHASGTNGVRSSVNGGSFRTSGLVSGLATLISALVGIGPSNTGNRCVGSVAIDSAVNPNVRVGRCDVGNTTGGRRGWCLS